MSQQIELADILRRVINANIQYQMMLSKLAVDCLQALIGSDKTHTSPPTTSSDIAHHETLKANDPSSVDPPISTIVLESEAGGLALGAFLIENGLPDAVDAPIEVSGFVGPDGAEIRPLLKFDPGSIRLESREQVLVRVVARIDKALEPDVRYRGVISVPGLPGTQVPLVLRRRESADDFARAVSTQPRTKSTHKVQRPTSARRSRKSIE